MGSSCKKTQQITITEEFRMDILDEPLQDVHIFHPKSSKPHYQVEEYEDGVMLAQITAILVKPKSQFDTIKILQQYCSVQEKIKQKKDIEQKKIHNHVRVFASSEKHVHWGN